MKKVISIVLVALLIFSMTSVYAGTINLNDFTSGSASEFNKMGSYIVSAIKVGATVVAIAMLLFVGIKFMMAAPAEKANLKGALIPYIVGAILIFAAIPILTILQNVASNF